MRQLNLKSKPKALTLQKVYELYRMDTGTETPDFIIKVLDLSYPKLGRDKIDVFDKMNKYQEAKAYYTNFLQLVEGMVGNGIS
jgi:hypothetical protein